MVAKRLDCGGFSAAFGRAKALVKKKIAVRAESGAEVTAVQTLCEVRGRSAVAKRLDCADFSGAFARRQPPPCSVADEMIFAAAYAVNGLIAIVQ